MSARRMRGVGVALAAWLVAACSATPTDDEREQLLSRSEGRQARTGEEVVIGVGKTARWDEQGILVTYLSLVGDSRCPLEAVCVWEGDAAVLLRIQGGSLLPQEVTLHTTLSAGPRRWPVGRWTLELVRVDPYPSLNTAPDPAKSTVALRLVSAGG